MKLNPRLARHKCIRHRRYRDLLTTRAVSGDEMLKCISGTESGYNKSKLKASKNPPQDMLNSYIYFNNTQTVTSKYETVLGS